MRSTFHKSARIYFVEKATCRNKSLFLAPPARLEPTGCYRLCYCYLRCFFVQSTPCSSTVCAMRINRILQTVATAFLRRALHLPPEASTPKTTSLATLSRLSTRLLIRVSFARIQIEKQKENRVPFGTLNQRYNSDFITFV